MVELLEALGPGNDLLRATIDHPVVLLLVLENPDNHRVGNRSAEIGGGHSVQALVLCDVIFEPKSVGLQIRKAM